MNEEQRKAARNAWRERKVNAGIFAFRGAGKVWVGASPTLEAAQNRLRFTLRGGAHRAKGLAGAWQAAQGAGFTFEVLERLDPDLSEMARGDALKSRAAAWCAWLGAVPL